MIFTYMESKKQTSMIETHSYTENRMMTARRNGICGLGGEGERIRKYKLEVRNSYGTVKYRTGSIVSNTKITM